MLYFNLYIYFIHSCQVMATHSNTPIQRSPSIPVHPTLAVSESLSTVNKPDSVHSTVEHLVATISYSCHDIIDKLKLACQPTSPIEEMDIKMSQASMSTYQFSCAKVEGLCNFLRELKYDQHYDTTATPVITTVFQIYLDSL